MGLWEKSNDSRDGSVSSYEEYPLLQTHNNDMW